MKSKFPGVVVIFLVMAFHHLSQGQQAFSIAGTVQTFHGELPDRPILVTLQFRGNTIATVFSDSEGKFSFSELSPNPYHVVVNDEKYRPVDAQVEINPLSSSVNFARIILVPKDAPAKPLLSLGSNPNMAGSAEYSQEIGRPAIKEFEKGVKSNKDGEIDEAIGHYIKAVRLSPTFYAARNNLGSAYLAKSQFADAQGQFEQVIKFNPSDAAAYLNLGNLFFLEQKYDLSEQFLSEGLSKEPSSAFGHFLRGNLFSRTGRPEKAEEELRQSLQLDPGMIKAHLVLVNLFLQGRRGEDAIIQLQEFLKAAPNDPFAPKAREVLKKLQQEVAENKKK